MSNFTAFISVVFLIGFIYIGVGKLLNIPQFEVGDCIAITSQVESNLERWETKKPVDVDKILEVGKEKYRVYTYFPATGHGGYRSVYFTFDDVMTKINCPRVLDGITQ